MPRSWSQRERAQARRRFETNLAASGDLRQASLAAGVSVRTGRRWRDAIDVAEPAPDRAALPVAPTSFEGREEELRALAHCYDSGRRLITVVGPPGVGKTRLALRFAEKQTERDPETEVVFCDLRRVREAASLETELAHQLGIQLSDAAHNANHGIGGVLAYRGQCLIVLDNFEELVDDGAPLLARWYREAPEARFLVTSRRVLRLRAESVFDLGPLSVPAEPDEETVQDESPALRLFWTRAHDAEPALSRTPQNVKVAADLVRHLDGLPLAIELAAAQVRRTSLATLLAEAQHSSIRLESPLIDADPEQRTLEAAIERSWNLLTSVEQETLALLTVFHRGFSARAAAPVLSVDEATASARLATLREASLVRVLDTGDDPERRHDLFESIREYASQRLPTTQEAHAKRRHAMFYVGEGERQRQLLETENGVAAHHRLQIDLANIEAAFETLADDATAASARGRIGLVLAAALLESQPGRASETITRVLRTAGRLEPDLHLRLRLARAEASRESGDTERTMRDLEIVGAELERRASVSSRAALAELPASHAYQVGLLAFYRGRSVEARRSFERAITLANEANDQTVEGLAHFALAHVLGDEFHDPDAFARHERAIHAFEACGNSLEEMRARVGRTSHQIWFQRDLREKDLALLEGVAKVSDVTSRRHGLAIWASLGLAYYHLDRADLTSARDYANRALALARRAGNVRLTGIAACARALVADEQGDSVDAATYYTAAAAIHARSDNPRQRAHGALLFAAHYARTDNLSAAERFLDEAYDALNTCGNLPWTDLLGAVEAHLEEARARRAGARGDIQRAIEHRRHARERVTRAQQVRRYEGVTIRPLTECSLGARHLLRLTVNTGAVDLEAAYTLWVAEDGSRFRFGNGVSQAVPSGSISRAALLALTEARLDRPGEPVWRQDLVSRCWPGERMRPESEARRTRDAIKRLRRLGLQNVVRTGQQGGYFLDPVVPVAFDGRAEG